MKRCHSIAITGGIGAGKSVVSAVLRTIGYEVVDCDAEAGRIMACDTVIHEKLCHDIAPDAVVDGIINKKRISDIVFSNPAKLQALNLIVHEAVRESVVHRIADGCGIMFFETAILYQSGFDSLADEVWVVEAPTEIRVARVMSRSNLTREQVIARIAAQSSTPECPHPHEIKITNDGTSALLPQILAQLEKSVQFSTIKRRPRKST